MSKLDRFLFRLIGFPFGWLLGVAFCLLEKLGILKVKNKQLLPAATENFILISNHPSLWEPLLLYHLFFKRYRFSLKDLPLSVPDNANYFSRWYWRPARLAFIPITRGSDNVGLALRPMLKALAAGKNIIVFPEGGRTFKGQAALSSASGKRIREFKIGMAMLAYKAKVKVVPVWVEGTDKILPYGKACPRFWRPATIKIGAALQAPPNPNPSRPDYEDFNQQLMQAVIDLADS